VPSHPRTTHAPCTNFASLCNHITLICLFPVLAKMVTPTKNKKKVLIQYSLVRRCSSSSIGSCNWLNLLRCLSYNFFRLGILRHGVKRTFTKHGRLKFQPKAELCLSKPMAWGSSAIIKTFIAVEKCIGLLLYGKTVDLTWWINRLLNS